MQKALRDNFSLPKKKTVLSDAESAKRLRETAKKYGTSDNPKDFEKAFKKVTGKPPS